MNARKRFAMIIEVRPSLAPLWPALPHAWDRKTLILWVIMVLDQTRLAYERVPESDELSS